MVARPTLLVVRSPLLSTDTILGLDDVHVMFLFVALLGVTVAKRGVLLPRPFASTVIASACEGVNRAMLIDATGITPRTTSIEVCPFAVLAVIVEKPGEWTVTLPLASTEATLRFDVVHVTFLCASRQSPCCLFGVSTALVTKCLFTPISMLVGTGLFLWVIIIRSGLYATLIVALALRLPVESVTVIIALPCPLAVTLPL